MPSEVFIPPKDTALDLPICGSIGSFSVKAKDGTQTSVLVQYIQTHVGFAVGGDAEERLLKQLAPVREVFDVTDLGFDELMQRDIDDSRVSTELIPYLLEEDGEALVKLFPPIIVVVLPINPQGGPAPHYPAVERFAQDGSQDNVSWRVIRSGEVGSEAFEFRQMQVQEREPDPHNYAQLKLNTTGCKLAIVDGQHRAMALLALYRNWKKEWPENTRQYQDYYKRWARSEIEKFDLSGIRLPIMLCTFPDIYEGAQQERRVTEACRSVFLALNKNARPVTRARNYLLDDDDLIAHLLRTVLEHIKQKDAGSQHALRLWNIELDGEGDRRALSTPMALSGVMHLYSLIEFLMLNSKWSGQFTIPRQNLWKKRDMTDCIRRLDAKSDLGNEACARANRALIERETAQIVCRRFWDDFGQLIVEALDTFRPYRIHNECALSLEANLRNEASGATYHSILFGGQGIGRVFIDYVDRLREERDELSDLMGTVPAELEASFSDFEAKKSELNRIIEKFYLDRSVLFLDCLSKQRVEDVHPALRDVYRNTLTTEAFQLALIITFFEAREKVNDKALRDHKELSAIEARAAFDEYIQQLNRFFTPTKPAEAFSILRVFYGDVKGGYSGPAEVNRSTRCLKKILIPGELKPDEWPKFRYILLELWNPSDECFSEYVDSQRRHLRLTAVSVFQDRELDREAKQRGERVSDLEDEAVQSISSQAKELFCRALTPLGVAIEPKDLVDNEAAQEAAQELEDVENGVDDESD